MEPPCPAPLCFTAGRGDTGTDYNTIAKRQVDADNLYTLLKKDHANSGCALLSGGRRLRATRGLPNVKGIKSFIVRMSARTSLRRWNYLYSTLDFKWRLIETLKSQIFCHPVGFFFEKTKRKKKKH